MRTTKLCAKTPLLYRLYGDPPCTARVVLIITLKWDFAVSALRAHCEHSATRPSPSPCLGPAHAAAGVLAGGQAPAGGQMRL